MYKNYGDVNFFDTGVLCKEVSENVYDIIMCNPVADIENHYLLSTMEIDITDDWIDKEDVCKWAGTRSYSIDYTDEEKQWFAVDVARYYGNHCGGEQKLMSKNEIIDWIDYGYIDEIEWDFYKDNFYEDNRNCVVEIFNNYSQGQKEIFNSLEDALEDFERRAEKGWSFTVVDM